MTEPRTADASLSAFTAAIDVVPTLIGEGLSIEAIAEQILDRLRESGWGLAELEPAEVTAARECWCRHCEDIVLRHDHRDDPVGMLAGHRFITCNECGDKRCPRASHHANRCQYDDRPPVKVFDLDVVLDPTMPPDQFTLRATAPSYGLFQLIPPPWPQPQHRVSGRSALVDSILNAYGVTERELPGPPLPPCARQGHDWTTWEYVSPPPPVFDRNLPEGYSLGLSGFYRRTCKRDNCPGHEINANGPI